MDDVEIARIREEAGARFDAGLRCTCDDDPDGCCWYYFADEAKDDLRKRYVEAAVTRTEENEHG